MESTYDWHWLVDLLMEEGYRLHLANPSGIQQYSGLKHGDDEDDAFWLAEMLRLKILPEGFIYPGEQRPLRDLLRKRGHLVGEDISHCEPSKHPGQEHMNTNRMKALRTDHVTPLLTGNDDLSLAGKVSKDAIDSLTRQIKAIEVVVEKR